MTLRRGIFAVAMQLMAGACTEEAQVLEDARCQDPRIATVQLDAGTAGFADFAPLDTDAKPATEGFCDGSDAIKLAAMDALGPGSLDWFRYLDRYDGAFFLIDGTCHFYALTWNGELTHGIVTSELLAQLTAELALDTLPSLPSSKDTRSPHYHDILVATSTHSLRCRDDACRTPEATAVIQQASTWIRKLADSGEASSGKLTAFALPESELTPSELEDPYYKNRPASAWPLVPTMRSLQQLVVTDRLTTPTGLEITGDDASALRTVRREALAKLDYEPNSVRVSDCDQTYELLLRDELPYKLHGDFTRFLQAAWERPVITSCFPGWEMPEVSPCPSDFID